MRITLKKSFRLRIFQPIVPEYRVALFDGIAVRYSGNVDLYAADTFGQDVSYVLHNMPFDYSHPFLRLGPFLWQKRVSLEGLVRGDIIVICGDVHQLSSLWIAFRAKLKGVKVVWWGHHKTATSKPFGVWIRLQVAKFLSDIYLCYTDTGRKWLIAHGFDSKVVFATGNTIDQRPIKKAISHWDATSINSWKASQGIKDKNIVLCCSVLREKIRLDLAIQALADEALRSRNVILAIIGDGPEKKKYEKLAKDIGVEGCIIWVGATRDQEVMAPWFLSSRLFLYPGSIGLSILHAFSYGLPVVTHGNANHQMPEFETMEDGRTGALFNEGDVGDMIEKISSLLDSPVKLLEMSVHVKQLAYERYSMENMVNNYCNAVEAASRAGRM